MDIITNNIPRDVIEAHELSDKERGEFDYLDWPAIIEGADSATFIRYKGMLLHLEDIPYIPDHHSLRKQGWEGYLSDTFFSGILVKYAPDTDFEQVIMGRYYA